MKRSTLVRLVIIWMFALLDCTFVSSCAHVGHYSDNTGAWTERNTIAPTR